MLKGISEGALQYRTVEFSKVNFTPISESARLDRIDLTTTIHYSALYPFYYVYCIECSQVLVVR